MEIVNLLLSGTGTTQKKFCNKSGKFKDLEPLKLSRYAMWLSKKSGVTLWGLSFFTWRKGKDLQTPAALLSGVKVLNAINTAQMPSLSLDTMALLALVQCFLCTPSTCQAGLADPFPDWFSTRNKLLWKMRCHVFKMFQKVPALWVSTKTCKYSSPEVSSRSLSSL